MTATEGRLPLLEDLPPLDGRRVLVRTDFNVPLEVSEGGDARITDDLFVSRPLQEIATELSQLPRLAAASNPFAYPTTRAS